MSTSFVALATGLGGGFVGDAAEFLNMAYDAIKKGFATGDFSDASQAAAQFGIRGRAVVGGSAVSSDPAEH